MLTSKFVHILLSLPSPKENTFQKIEKIYHKFLWGGKPANFRKEILCNTVEHGGLKYINLSVFDKALKVTWIRCILKVHEGWSIFPHNFRLHKIFLFGDNFINKIHKNCDDMFWKDVISACKTLYNSILLKTETNFKEI